MGRLALEVFDRQVAEELIAIGSVFGLDVFGEVVAAEAEGERGCVGGEPAELTLYRNPDGGTFFLPFVDATSGTETYGSGRYVEVELLSDGKIVVDVNYTYNPYCAYNDRWSSPLTPFENRLKVPLQAGEKSIKSESTT